MKKKVCVCDKHNIIFGKEQDRITNFTLNSDIVASLTQGGNTSCYTVAVLVLRVFFPLT